MDVYELFVSPQSLQRAFVKVNIVFNCISNYYTKYRSSAISK